MAEPQFGTRPPARFTSVLAAVESSYAYSRIKVGLSGGEDFSEEPFEAILPASVDGDLAIVDGEGKKKTIPQGAMQAGTMLPVEVQGIQAAGDSTQTLGDIVLLRK